MTNGYVSPIMDSMDKQLLKFKCEACGAEFEVEQGSRRRYCDKCLLERVKGGKRIMLPSEAENKS